MKITNPPRWDEHNGWVVAVFVVSLASLIGHQQLTDSTWTPHGADWDTWYQSILGLIHEGVSYPPNRWPIYGMVAAVFGLLPGPLHVNAQVASMAAAAGSIAGLFLISRTLIGFFGALTVAALTLTFPIVVLLSSWISSYPLWATAAIWGVAGLVEALRTGKRWWWLVAGSGTAVTFAVMAKGLGIGLILTGVIAGFALLDWRRLVGNLGRALLPLALLSLIYTAFPSPLLTLQAQIDIAEQGSRPTPPKAGPANASRSTASLFEGGYIFGRSMSPQMLKQTVLDAQDTTQDRGQRLSASVNGLRHVFPTVDLLQLKWLALGGVLGLLSGAITLLRGLRRGLPEAAAPLAGWVGTLGIIGGVLPSLLSHISTRFLTPGFFVVALFLVAPVALLSRWTRWLSWLPLLLLPLALSPQTPWQDSPWRSREATNKGMQAVLIPGHQALQVWYLIQQEHPDATIQVAAPAGQGLLVLDGRDGGFWTPDHRFHDTISHEISAGDLALVWEEANAFAMPSLHGIDVSERTVLQKWPRAYGASLVLYGAQASP